ncbi:TonB-dependent receptor plug domain-containing protein [Prevotella copri]|uniref:TonB-dependent receptor plug domain-containing protein n=1 Tax=Segatella copri TaxID=165179 RepID=A0A6G1TXI2_9BACT|nr:carboxypeptidase-like regulatory domain-containing protein [Segatella copri]MQN79500.1 TonB-dependent receptor plug domain-containing protein [Segatella copri]
MKQKFFIIIICLIATLKMMAQEFTLQGRVTNDDNNPVELATVSVVSQGKVAFTSLKGEFSMHLHSADSVAVKFSMIGYKTKVRVLRKPRGKQTLQVVLHTDATMLGDVNVTGEKIQSDQTQDIKVKDIKMAPSANGNGVEGIIQQQAGVSTHSELSSQYNVRGGAFDENSVYINNVEVYRPFLVRSGQQEGLSVINPYMVDKIGFSTGGYGAKYGDKMSSALDITYKTLKAKGKKPVVEGSVAASLLGADTYIGIGTRKLSWLNSVRYKTTSYLLGSLETKGEYKPQYLDYQTYLSYQPNKRWKIDFIGYISDNHYNFEPSDRETSFGTMENVKSFRVYFDGQEKDRFLTYFGTLGITRHITPNTSLSLLGSAFHTKEQEKYDIQGQYWLDQTETSENLGVGTYFEHARNYLTARVMSAKLMLRHKVKKHNAEAAVTLKREHIEENSIEYEMRDSAGYSVPHTGKDLYMIYSMKARNELNANRIEAYIQDTYRFSGGTADSTGNGQTHYTLNYGVRMSHWNFNRETILSPRISLAIIPANHENTTLRLAAGLYYQAPFFKELRDTTTVNGVTVASLNEKIKSQRSIHFIAGYDYRFRMNDQRFKFSAEAYYKALSNIVPYSVSNVKVVYYGQNECSGHAAGLDFKLYGEFVPGTDSWLSLSLMDTKMKLNGKSIPLPTDQRYAVNLFFTDYFPGSKKWRMSLKLAFADGLPFAAPHKELETNSFRATAYRRADIGMSYQLLDNSRREKKTFLKNVTLGVDCLNLFGIDNVNSYYWVTDVTSQQYAVPNYLTGRQLNARVLLEF